MPGGAKQFVSGGAEDFGEFGQDIGLRMAVLAFVIGHGGLLDAEGISQRLLADATRSPDGGEAFSESGGAGRVAI